MPNIVNARPVATWFDIKIKTKKANNDDKITPDNIENVKDDLWNFYFLINEGHLVVDKGSISINGISLTTNKINDSEIYISIIKHTYEETNLQHMKINDEVNIEYDIIGKYVYDQK